MHHLSIDLETYSSVPIGKAGAQKYIASPDFEILLFAYSMDGAPVVCVDFAQGERLPPEIVSALLSPEYLKHAYNASFEWGCLSKYMGRQLPPEQWRCTMLHGLYAGYTAGLDATGRALGLPEDKRKLSTGKALIGNSKNYDEFSAHYRFLCDEWCRVMMPGRLVSIHCMNLPAMKERDGFIGLKDFRGDVIRWMQASGFIFHSEVCIWKNPVVEMQRTKALGLQHKQIKKNSCMSRMGIPDYVVSFRKPGENPEPTAHTNESYPVDKWQQVASPVWEEYPAPVWWNINQSATLQRNSARSDKDEKHICPLQLPVIERCIDLWTNIGDIVLDPFDGIGSTGYQAIKMGRRHIGIELKGSYYVQAVANLKQAEGEIQHET